jgi:proline iminopeptidase
MYFVDMKWFAEVYTAENLDSVSIQTIVEDVDKIRKELGLNNPLVMGHSIHGTIAMEYTKKFADKVSGVVVIGSPAKFGSEEYTQKAEALWATASDERKAIQEENWGKVKEIDRLTGKEATAAEYNRASPQYWYDPYYDANWLWDGMTVHTEVTDNLFSRVFSEYDMFREPVNIRKPVLVVMGIYDYVIPYTLWETEYESIDDYTFLLFEKSGHTPQLEEQEHFDKMLINWLNEKIQ